jgi:hypothetical protein
VKKVVSNICYDLELQSIFDFRRWSDVEAARASMKTLVDHVVSCEDVDLAFFRTHNVAYLAQQALEVSRDSQVVDLAWDALEGLAKIDLGFISDDLLNSILACVPLESESAQKHFVSILDMLSNESKCPSSAKVVECLTTLSSTSDIEAHRSIVNVFTELSRSDINCLSILKPRSVVNALMSLAESEVVDVSIGALASLFCLSKPLGNRELLFSKNIILRLLELTKSDNDAAVEMSVMILSRLSSEGLNRDRFNDKKAVETLVPLLDSDRPLVAGPACSVIESMSKVHGHSVFQSHEAIMAVLELAWSDSIRLAHVSANVLFNVSAEFDGGKGMVDYPGVVDVAMELLKSPDSMMAHKGAEILSVLGENSNNCRAIMQRDDLIEMILERIGLDTIRGDRYIAEFFRSFSSNGGNYLGKLNQEKVVTGMVRLVNSDDPSVVRTAGSVLSNLSCVLSNVTGVLQREDVVSSALKLIRTEYPDCAITGFKILEGLSRSDENKTGILKRDDLLECVLQLVGRFDGIPDKFVVFFLRRLSDIPENCSGVLATKSVVSTLLKLGKSKNFQVAEIALIVMSNLSKKPENARGILRDPVVVRELVEFLDHSNQLVFVDANDCLVELARNKKNCRTIFRDKALIARLKQIADNPDNTHMQHVFSRTLLMTIFASQTTFKGLNLDMSHYIVFMFQTLSKWPITTRDSLDAVYRNRDEFSPEVFSCDPVRKAIHYFDSQEENDQIRTTLDLYRRLSGTVEVEDSPYTFIPFR